MPPEFPGKDAKSGMPITCIYCKDVAVYNGSSIIKGFREFSKLCITHGPQAIKDRIVNTLEELNEYKAWKKKNEMERAKSLHPSTPQLRLLREE